MVGGGATAPRYRIPTRSPPSRPQWHLQPAQFCLDAGLSEAKPRPQYPLLSESRSPRTVAAKARRSGRGSQTPRTSADDRVAGNCRYYRERARSQRRIGRSSCRILCPGSVGGTLRTRRSILNRPNPHPRSPTAGGSHPSAGYSLSVGVAVGAAGEPAGQPGWGDCRLRGRCQNPQIGARRLAAGESRRAVFLPG